MSDKTAAAPTVHPAEKHKQRGNECFRRREFAQAIAYYTRAITAVDSRRDGEPVPSGCDVHILLSNRAAAWLAAGDAAKACVDAKACVEKAPDFSQGFGRLGTALHSLGKHSESVAAFRKAVSLDPSSERLKAGMKTARAALAEFRRNNAPSASSDDGVPLPTGSTPTKDMPGKKKEPTADELKLAGNAALKAGETRKAVKLYTDAMSAPGGAANHVLFSNRAAALTAIGTRESLSRAVADCTKCSALRPDFAKAFSRKTRALLALGRATDALNAANDGLRLDPMNAALRQAHTEAQTGTGALGTAAKEAWSASIKESLAVAEAKDAEVRQIAKDAARSGPQGIAAAEEAALKLLQAQLADVASESRSAKRSRETAGSDESSGEDDDPVKSKHTDGDGDDDGDGGVAGRAAKALGWEDAEPSAAQEAAAIEAAALWKPGTAEEQLERLTGSLAQWRCLNPFGVLQLDENGPPDLANARFKKLSTLVHPDKHPLDEERARSAFEAVKSAAEAIKDDEKRSWARRLVRQGKRKAARLTRRARRAKSASSSSSSSSGPSLDAQAATEAETREVLKAFATAEHRRRTLEDSLRKEAQADAMEVDEERAAMKRERNADTTWAGERTDRVDSWRRFQGSSAAGKGLKRDKVSTFGGKAAAEVAASAGDGTSEFKSTWR